ncbi:hypothetical protein MMC25_007281 [Agyrium rufum]|nr:hypothetical protein [Agyrium rufum]
MLSHLFSRTARQKGFLQLLPPTIVPCSAGIGVNQTSRPDSHQRRKSSSKSSNAQKNDLRPIATTASEVPSKEVAATPAIARRRSPTKITRSKTRAVAVLSPADASKHELLAKLPAVPSTQHLHPHEIHVASFFSIHRPISVTSAVPSESTETRFSRIFEAQSKRRTVEVMYTLSNAIQRMESGTKRQMGKRTALRTQQDRQDDGDRNLFESILENQEPQPASLIQNNGESFGSTELDMQDLNRQFPHFVPPPAPVPIPSYQQQYQMQERYQQQQHQEEEAEADAEQQNQSGFPFQRSSRYPGRASRGQTFGQTQHQRASPLNPRVLSLLRQQGFQQDRNLFQDMNSYRQSTQQHQRHNPPAFFEATIPQPSQALVRFPMIARFPSPIKQPFLCRMFGRQLESAARAALKVIVRPTKRIPRTGAASMAANATNVDGYLSDLLEGITAVEIGQNLVKEMWRCISVKRQRKLKMKKHKYKKLMRRTRNLRRKLDKL